MFKITFKIWLRFLSFSCNHLKQYIRQVRQYFIPVYFYLVILSLYQQATAGDNTVYQFTSFGLIQFHPTKRLMNQI